MRILNYNFEDLAKSLSSVKDNSTYSYAISNALNSFFPDIKCVGVKYTQNIDNEFFGLFIQSVHIDPKKVMDMDGDNYEFIKEYMVEIDSKLADALTPMELTAILINEIKNIVSSTAMDKFRNSISYYIGMNNMSINLDNMVHYEKAFALMYNETVNTMFSVLDIPTTDVVVGDDFISGCGLYEYFNSAIDKIKSIKESVFVNELSGKLLLMQWYLSVINEMHINKRYISTVLREAFECTGSKLLRNNILNTITELEPMTDTTLHYYQSLTESAKKKSLFGQIKDSGLRSLEQDVYEYTMRIKNVEDENDALMLMRQINNRINILEDYINNEELDDRAFAKWNSILDKYYTLRETLTKKTIYKQKMYGLFADYNVLQKMYMRGELNTIY